MAKLAYERNKDVAQRVSESFARAGMKVFYSKPAKMMVGIMPTILPNGDIYNLYVTLCNPKDKFKKKLGLIALGEAYYADQFIPVKVLGSPESFALEYMHLASYGESAHSFIKELEL